MPYTGRSMARELRAGVSRSTSPQGHDVGAPSHLAGDAAANGRGGGTSSAAAPTPSGLPNVWYVLAPAMPPPQPPSTESISP